MEYAEVPAIFFEDIELHKKLTSKTYLLTDNDIVEFAHKWDPMPFHINPEFAEKSMFGGLIASGSHQFAICYRLAGDIIRNEAILAALGIDQLRFLAPARPGDTLTAEGEFISKRDSESIPNAGIVQTFFRLTNQHGEDTLSLIYTGLVKKRPKEG